MYQQMKILIAKGIPFNQIVYLTFEDERLLEISTDELNLILEVGRENSASALIEKLRDFFYYF